METNLPLVSIIIPCLNEEKFIGKCLDSVVQQDFPKEKTEVLVIDGESQDKTKIIIGEYSVKFPFIKLLNNPQKFTPFGLNIGIKMAKGEVILRLDTHAHYSPDYVSKSVKYLKESEADNVGGIIKTLPAENTLMAKSIALTLSSFFGVGLSYFRKGVNKPRPVDTVFGGCFKKEIFQKLGFFNENLIRSQDLEFNRRLKKAGGKIMLFPDIIAFYYPEASLSGFLRHNFQDGFWTTYSLKFGIKFFSYRHLLPLIWVVSLLLTWILGIFFFWSKFLFVLIFGSYLILNLFFSLKITIGKDFRQFFILPLVFFSRHFFYGLGALWGLISIKLNK